MPEVLRAELFEEPGVEVARIVDQHVDPAEPLDCSLDGDVGSVGVGSVLGAHDDQVWAAWS